MSCLFATCASLNTIYIHWIQQANRRTHNNGYDAHETHAHTLDANHARLLNRSDLYSEVCSPILPTSIETQRQVMFLLGCHESETQPLSSWPYKPQKKKSRQPLRACYPQERFAAGFMRVGQ